MVYLDHAATTPVPKAVADVMYRVLTETFGNPSSQYPLGRDAAALVERSRRTVAEALGCAPERFVFTSCGSEADNWAISLAARQGRHIGRHIITTAVEHSAVLEPCRLLEQDGWTVTYLKPDRLGRVTAEQVADALREDTVLVSMMLVNSETGNVYPIRAVADALRARGSKALLHTDAVQGFLKLPFTPDELGADLVSVSGHKIGAPKGIGGLYVGPRCRAPRPLIAGGGQEMGLRSGTEATAQIAGFAKAVELRLEDRAEKERHMRQIRDYAFEQLAAIDGVVPLGTHEAPHIIAFSLVGYPSANAVNELGAQGVCVSAGSACHKGKPSHVYAAMGLDKRTAGGALRISIGPDTTQSDIDAAVAALRAHRDTRFPML